MRAAVPILAVTVLLAACGGETKDPAPTPSATARAVIAPPKDPALAHYSEGVQRYYAGAQLGAADQDGADAEAKYFQPPRPAEANLGDTIRLTGANIGVQVDVTPKQVERVEIDGEAYTQVEVELDNDAGGITVLDGEVSATLTSADGEPQPAVKDVKAPSCETTIEASVRVDVDEKQSACLLFPAADGDPERLQLALETVPVTAGGIWHLAG